LVVVGAVTGVELRGLMLATQVLYHLSHSTNPCFLFCFGFFGAGDEIQGRTA
jgi:hypothetical protein